MELVKEVDGKKLEDFAIEFMKTYGTYTQDQKLDALMDYIPFLIENFQDCSSEEEYRMLAKKQDNTLATIQIPHKKSGWLLYKPISLNAEEYKNFYFQTLVFSLVQYVMFYQGAVFTIVDNDKYVGTLAIQEEQLPHILGLENKFVSKKESEFMGSIIPGYNLLGILDKILCLVENKERIMQWEKENDVDIFNYYKNMQKNKEFLLMGRFFEKNEELPEGYNKVFLLQSKSNQLSLYKKSNMNKNMQRNISKMIIQRGMDDVYFPRSLQGISDKVLHTSEFHKLMQERPGSIVIDGLEALVSAEGYSLDVKIPSRNQRLSKHYLHKSCIRLSHSTECDNFPDVLTEFTLVKHLFEFGNVSDDILEPYRKLYLPISTEFNAEFVDEFDLQQANSNDECYKFDAEEDAKAAEEWNKIFDSLPENVANDEENIQMRNYINSIFKSDFFDNPEEKASKK